MSRDLASYPRGSECACAISGLAFAMTTIDFSTLNLIVAGDGEALRLARRFLARYSPVIEAIESLGAAETTPLDNLYANSRRYERHH